MLEDPRNQNLAPEQQKHAGVVLPQPAKLPPPGSGPTTKSLSVESSGENRSEQGPVVPSAETRSKAEQEQKAEVKVDPSESGLSLGGLWKKLTSFFGPAADSPPSTTVGDAERNTGANRRTASETGAEYSAGGPSRPGFSEAGEIVSLGPVTQRPSHFHGSGSASLVSVIKIGLQAAGDLIRRGDAPFSGELQDGIQSNGVNQTAISAVTREFITKAIEYTGENGNRAGWTPEEGRKNIDWMKKCLRDGPAFGGPMTEKDRTGAELQIKIEEQRIEKWNGLSSDEQKMIARPFPVVYGIINGEFSTSVRSSISGEQGIKAVPADRLVAFVPNSKVSSLRKLAEGLESGIKIEPYDRMTEYYGSTPPLALEWALRSLNKYHP